MKTYISLSIQYLSWGGNVYVYLFIFTYFYDIFFFTFLFCMLFFGVLVQLVFGSVITVLLSSLTPALFNLRMNLNPETMVHDDIYNAKYRYSI